MLELDHKESRALKNWCFWIVGWISLESPWTARASNQSILKEISPECSLEKLMLKLKLQYFGHLMWKAESLENTLMLGKIEGRRRRGRQRTRWLDGITNTMDMGLGGLWEFGDGQGSLACCGSWGRKESDTIERLNWTELNVFPRYSRNSCHPLLPPLCPQVCSLCCIAIAALQVHQYHLSIFHMHALIYNICLSLSGLPHSVL